MYWSNFPKLKMKPEGVFSPIFDLPVPAVVAGIEPLILG
jgi:hypothetical protein